jgi:hypothetical protein
MKVSLANLLKTELEKMSDFVPEQKLMKTNDFYVSEQKLIITKALIRFRGRGQSGELRRTDDYGSRDFGGESPPHPWFHQNVRPR